MAGSTWAFERGFDAWRSAYDVTLRWTLRHQRVVMLALPRASASLTGVLFARAPKGFLPSEDAGPALLLRRGAAGHLLRRDGRAAAAGRRHHRARTRTSRPRCRSSAPAAPRASLNVGRITITLKPFDQRKPADAGHARAAAEARERARRQGLHAERAGDPHRRPAHQEPVPVRAAQRQHRGALPLGAADRAEAARAARAWST